MFKMPKAVAQKIVKLQRRFFWGSYANDNTPIPTFKWSDIELPKQLGGLGVGNILHKNLVLLFKWWCRFSEGDCTLWKRILRSIYDIKSLKASSDSFARVNIGLLGQLLSNEQDTKRIKEIVEEGMQVSVGDGNSTLFWHDRWVSAGPLMVSFPRLFSISLQGEAVISQMGVWSDGVWVWNFCWRRRLFDWEHAEVERLTLLVEHFSPQPDKIDGVSWHGGIRDRFPIRDILNKLYESYELILPMSVTNLLWSIKVPPRVHLIIWMASLEKLKTGDLLVEKGLIDVSSGICPFCNCNVETNSHILFSCNFSWSVWMMVLNW